MSRRAERDRTPPVVAIGASAGGVEALRTLVPLLPGTLEAAVLVVLHLPPDSPSALPAILRRTSQLQVRPARDGDELQPGVVYVARPDHHLVVSDGHLLLSRGPRENGHRPAIDVLFRSAARARGARTMAVVLSGTLDDGTAGAVAVAARGGRVATQDFDEALYADMPRSAARAVEQAEVLTTRDLATAITTWARQADDRAPLDDAEAEQQDGHHEHDEMQQEVDVSLMDPEALHDPDRPGRPSGFGCPDCAGALFQIDEGPLTRFRCRVGHAWSVESLLARQSVELESALWVALRSLEERAALNAELGERAGRRGHGRTAARFEENAQEATGAAELVRGLIADIDRALATATPHRTEEDDVEPGGTRG